MSRPMVEERLRKENARLKAELSDLRRRFDETHRGLWGETSLHEAAVNGQVEKMRTLLAAGADDRKSVV